MPTNQDYYLRQGESIPDYWKRVNPSGVFEDNPEPPVGDVYNLPPVVDPLVQQAQTALQTPFNQGMPDQDKINADTLASFQREIDSLNAVYAQKKAEVIRQQQEMGTRRMGTQRAQLAASGMLGQVSGSGQQEELQQANLSAQNAAVGMVEAEQGDKLARIMGQARQDAKDIYKEKYNAYMGSAEDIMDWADKKKGLVGDSISKQVKNAIASGIDWSNTSGVKPLVEAYKAQGLDISAKDIVAEFKSQRSILDEAQKAQELETEKTLTGIDYQKAQTAKIDYEMNNPDIKTTVQEIDGRMKMFNSQTGALIKDLGPITAKEGTGGLTKSQVNSTVNSIAGAFDNEPIVKSFNLIAESKNFVDSIPLDTTNPADDIGLVYSLAKALDPTSVVREGEYATVQKYSQSWVKQYGKSIEQAMSGTGFLSKEARKSIKDTITTRYNASEKSYQNVKKEYQRQIDEALAGEPRKITEYSQTNKEELTDEQLEKEYNTGLSKYLKPKYQSNL